MNMSMTFQWVELISLAGPLNIYTAQHQKKTLSLSKKPKNSIKSGPLPKILQVIGGKISLDKQFRYFEKSSIKTLYQARLHATIPLIVPWFL